jgi:uncharacterized RDD family membrane protein YckC
VRRGEDEAGEPAGFVTRLLAFGIDNTIVALGTQTAIWFLRGVRESFGWWRSIPLEPQHWLPFLLPFVGAVYSVGCWCFAGATPGKWLLGLRVQAPDGKNLTLRYATRRYLGYFLSALPMYLGFLVVLWSKPRLAWHDRLAKSRVVYNRPHPLGYQERGAQPQ